MQKTTKKNKNKKKQPRVLPEFVGRAQMTREGFVFVICEGSEEDILVKPSKTRHALNGDTVRVVVIKDNQEDTHKLARGKKGVNSKKQDTKNQKNARKRYEGEIVEIIERSKAPFIGIFHSVRDQAWVLMQSRNMPYDIEVDPFEAEKMGAEPGMKVSVLVDGWKRSDSTPYGHICDVLGIPGENDTEMHAILAEFNLPYRFSEEVENAADEISEVISNEDIRSRRDMRECLTFTIDPADAKDFDDALSFRRLANGNFEVGVHIADVSHYVKEGSLVDKEARERGTSVYLVDRTIPMLPEKLSNKLCSLREGEDKLVFSVVFEISPRASVKSRWIGRGIIRSDRRLDYDQAQAIIEDGPINKQGIPSGIENAEIAATNEAMREKAEAQQTSDNERIGANETIARQQLLDSERISAAEQSKAERIQIVESAATVEQAETYATSVSDKQQIAESAEIIDAILTLNKLALILRKNARRAGAIDFDRPEMKVIVDEKGRPIDVFQKVSKESNSLIEQFMLLANRTIAEYIATAGKMNSVPSPKARPFVYRIHGEPNEIKLNGLQSFAKGFGYKFDSNDTLSGRGAAHSLNRLLEQAKGRPEFAAIETLALRSMAKAVYSTENIGHYGLAFKYYTHFTSPIRRYPDLIVHRLLGKYLEEGIKTKLFSKDTNKESLESLCKYASEREQIAADAERSSIKYKLVEFLQDKEGMEFDGHISGLTEWGMYVEIEPTKIEGMIPLRSIRSDFFEFDEAHYMLRGLRTHRKYRLGNKVRVRVKSAVLEQRLIDYELIEPRYRK